MLSQSIDTGFVGWVVTFLVSHTAIRVVQPLVAAEYVPDHDNGIFDMFSRQDTEVFAEGHQVSLVSLFQRTDVKPFVFCPDERWKFSLRFELTCAKATHASARETRG